MPSRGRRRRAKRPRIDPTEAAIEALEAQLAACAERASGSGRSSLNEELLDSRAESDWLAMQVDEGASVSGGLMPHSDNSSGLQQQSAAAHRQESLQLQQNEQDSSSNVQWVMPGPSVRRIASAAPRRNSVMRAFASMAASLGEHIAARHRPDALQEQPIIESSSLGLPSPPPLELDAGSHSSSPNDDMPEHPVEQTDEAQDAEGNGQSDDNAVHEQGSVGNADQPESASEEEEDAHQEDAAAEDGGGDAHDGHPGRGDARMPLSPHDIQDLMLDVAHGRTHGVVARPVRVVAKAKRPAVADVIAARLTEATAQLEKGGTAAAQQAAIFSLLRVPADLEPTATRSDRQGRQGGMPAPEAGKARGFDGLPHDLQRVVKAMRSGDMSKAGRYLEAPGGLAKLTPESMSALAAKHPLDPTEPDMTITAADQAKCANINMQTLKQVVFGTPNGRAAGPSGWTFELLKLTMGRQRGRQALLELVQQLAVGGSEHNSALMTCGLTVLEKKGGGIRPIAVAEPIVSTVSKCLARAVRHKAARHFKGRQYAGGMKHGLDAAILSVKNALVQMPGSVVMSVDIANAFNEGFRAPMWDRVKAALPEVLPWVSTLYGKASPLHMQGVRLLYSQSGQRQGDALSMLLFCITLQPALEQAEAAMREAGHEAVVAAYADDVKVVASREACDVFLEHFEAAVATIGLQVNRSKTEYYDPREDEGCMLFGAPTGTDAYVRSHAQEVLDLCQHLANRCVLLAEEGFVSEADQLLRRCIRAKAAALLRVTELPSDMVGAANTWLLASLRLVLGIPDLGWAHAAGRPSEGGLACPQLVNTARVAESKTKKHCLTIGIKLPTESVHVAFASLFSQSDDADAHQPGAAPSAPCVEGEAGTRTEDQKRRAGKAFRALPQWIMSAAQCVPGSIYKVAIRVHLGLARMPVGLAAAHLRRYPSTAAAWENLRLKAHLTDPHNVQEMRVALRGCGSFIRTRLSFALMFDVAEMAADHEKWQRRKQQAQGVF